MIETTMAELIGQRNFLFERYIQHEHFCLALSLGIMPIGVTIFGLFKTPIMFMMMLLLMQFSFFVVSIYYKYRSAWYMERLNHVEQIMVNLFPEMMLLYYKDLEFVNRFSCHGHTTIVRVFVLLTWINGIMAILFLSLGVYSMYDKSFFERILQ